MSQGRERGEQVSCSKQLWEWTGFGGNKLWDVLEPLSSLAIPVVLAIAGLMFSVQQDQRQRAIEDERIRHDREIEKQSAQNTAVQAYLDQMNQLMFDGHLRSSPKGSEVRTLAQARTLAALGRLDPERKETLLRFLYEANLIDEESPVVSLDGVNLRGIDLSGNNLSGGPYLVEPHLATYLGGDRRAGYLSPELAESIGGAASDLSGADLGGADLSGALLAGVNLSGANLSGAKLQNARAAGDAARAARLFGVAEMLLKSLDAALDPGGSLDYDSDLTTARTRLGEEARAEGRAMTFEQAVAYALSEISAPGSLRP